ncbi:hypothetical protein [Streptomyces sp. NPDC056632]|uniref:hypothetical protein n=1 Tax=Streptomyces sp. NPDC056632 TaxID=3345884 RepID=UPI0036ACC747
MTTVSQNFAATRAGIEAMRACVAESTGIRESVTKIIHDMMYGEGSLTGPAYAAFEEVWTIWDGLMKAEIQRLNDFASTAEKIVREQEQGEMDRWRELFGMKERAPWADLIPAPPLE